MLTAEEAKRIQYESSNNIIFLNKILTGVAKVAANGGDECRMNMDVWKSKFERKKTLECRLNELTDKLIELGFDALYTCVSHEDKHKIEVYVFWGEK